MTLEVFDYRNDVRNVVISPEIRARFLRLEPGEVADWHSHDLGHEVFLVLEGQCEFEIDGTRAVLGPGQMCFVRADQLHRVRTFGDEPMTMYLSVTPHVEPTHTQWDAQGNKLSPRYGRATQTERAAQAESPESLAELVARHVAAAQALAQVAAASAEAQEAGAAALERAVATGDPVGAKAAVDAMWPHLSRTIRSVHALAAVWNELAPRADP